MHKNSNFSASLASLFFGNSSPSGCGVASHCGVDLHFYDYWYWTSSHVFIDHLYIFYGNTSILLPILKLFLFLLSFRSSLYINSLSYMWFTNIFSRLVGCNFIWHCQIHCHENFALCFLLQILIVYVLCLRLWFIWTNSSCMVSYKDPS